MNTPHFRFLGVPVTVKPAAPLPPTLIGLAIYAVARWTRVPQAGLTALLGVLVWLKADWLHTAGHVASAQLADAPMDYIAWGILPVNGYHNQDVAPQQHIGRSLGGLAASALAVPVYWMLWRMLGAGMLKRLALVGLVANATLLAGGLTPLPFFDGGVILKNLPKL